LLFAGVRAGGGGVCGEKRWWCVVRDDGDMSRMINKDVHGDGSRHMMHLIIYNI